MSGAVRGLCGDLKFYGNAARKNGFVEMCLSAVNELKAAGISADELTKTLYSPEKTRLNGCLSILPRRWAILRRYTAFMIKS